ncbi:MAG: LysR family transcriptional regulator, partial [Sneathiella sp.]|nr:LysR family transcriptional regulator [Sneathiella sp.]
MELLEEMGVFATVVDKQSFSEAAISLNMSKSSVSRKLANLEEQLGIRLLQRTTRKLGLTDSGRIYYDYCARVIAEAKQANASMRYLQAAPRGVLRISLPETFGRFFVLPLMPEFMEAYPEIQLNINFSSRNVDLIGENFDLAIRKGKIEDESLILIGMGHS